MDIYDSCSIRSYTQNQNTYSKQTSQNEVQVFQQQNNSSQVNNTNKPIKTKMSKNSINNKSIIQILEKKQKQSKKSTKIKEYKNIKQSFEKTKQKLTQDKKQVVNQTNINNEKDFIISFSNDNKIDTNTQESDIENFEITNIQCQVKQKQKDSQFQDQWFNISKDISIIQVKDNQCSPRQYLNTKNKMTSNNKSCSIGKIIKNQNNKTLQTTTSQQQHRIVTQYYKQSQKEHINAIQYCENDTLSTSRVIQNKIAGIFHQLDQKQNGYLSKDNWQNKYLEKDIQFLLHSIQQKIEQGKSYSQKQFLKEICNIAIEIQEQQIHNKFTLPILNYTYKSKQYSQRKNSIDSIISNRKNSYSNFSRKQSLQKPLIYPVRYSKFYKHKTLNQNSNNKHSYASPYQFQNVYKVFQQNQRQKLKQINNTDQYNKLEFKTKNQPKFNFDIKSQSLNSTLSIRTTRSKIFPQKCIKNQTFSNNNYKHTYQEINRIEALNLRLQEYINKNIGSTYRQI